MTRMETSLTELAANSSHEKKAGLKNVRDAIERLQNQLGQLLTRLDETEAADDANYHPTTSCASHITCEARNMAAYIAAMNDGALRLQASASIAQVLYRIESAAEMDAKSGKLA